MKKLACLGLSLAMALGLMTGCGSSNNGDATSNQDQSGTSQTQTQLTGTVNTDGSTSMESVVKALGEAFMEMNPEVTVNYSGTGSGTGIQSTIDGTCDLGLSSRALKDEEKTNWSELGGTDGEIAVFGREAGSGTRGAFEEIVGVEDACKYTNEYSSTGDVIGNVASNPNAIGYASLSAVDDTVKAVKVNGVAPSEDTVKDGTYEIQRPFVMVTKDGAELSEAAQAFLEFAMSEAAADIIAAAGAVSPKG